MWLAMMLSSGQDQSWGCSWGTLGLGLGPDLMLQLELGRDMMC